MSALLEMEDMFFSQVNLEERTGQKKKLRYKEYLLI
jgi:hypothetical protein